MANSWSEADLADFHARLKQPPAALQEKAGVVVPVPIVDIPGFVIMGPVRSKKTSTQIITIPQKGSKRCPVCGKMKGFPKIIPSEAHQTWHADAMQQCLIIKSQLKDRGVELPIQDFVSLRALFYQDVDRSDATGLYESLADLLQDAEILENDRLIADWDLSRRLVDKANPRVEVFLKILRVKPSNGNLFE